MRVKIAIVIDGVKRGLAVECNSQQELVQWANDAQQILTQSLSESLGKSHSFSR